MKKDREPLPLQRNPIWSVGVVAIGLILAGGPTVSAGEPVYGQSVVVPAAATAAQKESAGELSHWLEIMTGGPFPVVNVSTNRGVFLVRSDSPLAPPELAGKLQGRGPEAFYIRSDDEIRLWIVGNSDRAIEHGVYFYLDRLGYRWFFPNDHWTIIPQGKSIQLKINRIESPAFRMRALGGTGGFGGKLPVDPNQEIQARWKQWEKRNLLDGEIQVSGHAGEGFNQRHKAELTAHPEYLAEIGGKRQPWGLITKPCYANPDFRKLYIEDRLAEFKQRYDHTPDDPHNFGVSVEPSDGGGHCECAQCRKIGTISDRVYFLANEVARALAAKYPGRYATLFAYNEHAAVPNIALEPNVFVTVCPYGLQRTGLDPEPLLQAWAKKHPALGVYDYWAITDWNNCLPTLSFLTTVPGRIRLWHSLHVDAFLGQSDYSAGALGIDWYLASRILWNPGVNAKAVLEDFYQKSFGPAAPPMSRMLERWTKDFMLTGHELGLSYRDLREARALAKDPAVLARLDDYARYLHYIRLWYEYREPGAAGGDHQERTRALLTWIWRIYDSAMVHSFRMHQLLCSRYEPDDKSLNEEWPLKDPAAGVWTSLKPVSAAELANLMAEGAERYRPLEFEPREYTGPLVALTTPDRLGEPTAESPRFSGTHRFAFLVSPKTTGVRLQMRCLTKRADYPGDPVSVIDPKGNEVYRQTIPTDGEPHELKIATLEPGLYQMTIADQKMFYELKVPPELPFVVQGSFTSIDLSPRVYFYVPKGLRKLAVYAPGVRPIEVFDAAGQPVKHEPQNLFVVNVPPGQDAKVWSLKGYKSYTPLKLLNAPRTFSFSPAGLMVPEDWNQ